jgi:acetylornithine deacetylase/succinyl-diaminopimelate desuccinylase-like protein
VSVKRILFGALCVLIAVVAILALLWWFGMRMPGKNISKAAPLSPYEITLREELRADVQKLAGEIGERNMWRYAQLNAAADFIEDSFSRASLHPRRDSYELHGQACHNIEVEISRSQGAAVSPGRRSLGEGGSPPPPIILIGAHYDSVFASPGANDNASGEANTES